MLVLTWLLIITLIYLHKDRVQLVRLPPESLTEWYKPESKRQLWLHNMFSLRRDLQAIEQSSAQRQQAQLELWLGRFEEHYHKTAEMVPEWEDKLELHLVDQMIADAGSGNYPQVQMTVDTLRRACDDCHDQYRAVTAALYRSPDFEGKRLHDEISLRQSMLSLNNQVNNIKIAAEQGENEAAWTAFGKLKQGLDQLDDLCVRCHEYAPKTYLDASLTQLLDELGEMLKTGTLKQQNRKLGEFAVLACAQCHGTHRIAYDIKKLLSAKESIRELLTH